MSLLLEEAALNGTDRVAFDGLATKEQCSTLMNLVHVKDCFTLKVIFIKVSNWKLYLFLYALCSHTVMNERQ